ncbi:MAG: hypothetical protein UR56_C0016G0016 [Candidatus Roizmanbacteria bacterium GW2011_GWC2_34_23]|uniref:Four helix bundle protein n=1 Tax=Candidatus Roizmanbacteria bacterium GW2011_GWC2_34_23 TaxID=1618484 RepID=A0A0G0DCX2_9BACT|nr:MAG: hypothetical protein UR56_C0016G0016 [Candidatus Roizmanbacteria bacterium GW2011_GWC2_34_23]
MLGKQYLKLEDLNSYIISSNLSDYIWKLVVEWKWFEKRTLGAQLTDATDSIAANIAEGFGRYHKKDKIKFYYNARASAYESAHWIKKASIRQLITQKDFDYTINELRKLPKEINHLINFTQTKLSI